MGSAAFRKELLERMVGELGEAQAGELRRESAEARAERIIAEELRREGWRGAELTRRREGDPVKLALAVWLRRAFAAPERLRPRRRETTLPVGWIAARLNMGTRQSTATRLQEFKRQRETGSGK